MAYTCRMESKHTTETLKTFANLLLMQEAHRNFLSPTAQDTRLPHIKRSVMDFCIKRIKTLKKSPETGLAADVDVEGAIALYTDIFWQIAFMDDSL